MSTNLRPPSQGEATEPASDPLVGMHYHLCSYVCGSASIRPSPFDEPKTFQAIFDARPDGCRFGVAQMVPLRVIDGVATYDGRRGPFVVWDFFDEQLVKGQRTGPVGTMPPPPLWMGDSEDGMTMKAVALYTHGS